MAMYAINDTTLTAIGDAIRSKTDKYISVEEQAEPFYIGEFITSEMELDKEVYGQYYLIKTLNLKELLGDMYDYTKYLYYESEYNADSAGVVRNFGMILNSNGAMASFVSTDSPNKVENQSGTITFSAELDNITVRAVMWNTKTESAKVKLKLWACDADNKYLKLNGYTPLEMAEVIDRLVTMPEEAFYLTGDKSYAFQRNNNSWLIKNYGDKITTDKLTNMSYMFQHSTMEAIPFDLNVDLSKTTCNVANLFYNCNYLKEVPLINNFYVYTANGVFSGCQRLRYLPEGFAEDWDFSGINNSTSNSLASFFYSCYSLRAIPEVLRKKLWNKSTASYNTIYSSGFGNCYSLDELTDLGITTASLTSNVFNNTFYYDFRLAELTFGVNEDGTPKTAKWKSQTIDLSQYVGYINESASNVINYNSGITADKEVKDDATYQALKNDPDWFSCDVNYSRYNHTSAVNTINSLPDCSATGTNTIKFKGSSGALTDGGAINTLTEEEIAVATAKGWTVSLV